MTKRFITALALLLSASCWAASYPRQYDWLLEAYSNYYLPELDWQLLKAQCWQESRLKPEAVSPVGAKGLCQFMPATWREMQDRLKMKAGPFNPIANVRAAAFYMRQLRRQWSSPRPEYDRQCLALASYNCGLGNMLAAQRACNGAIPYAGIAKCLPEITGHHSKETLDYVRLVWEWHEDMTQ